MKQKQKKTILIDLDGVLNEYDGNFDEKYIPPVRAGAKDFLKELSKDYKVVIFTTRAPLSSSKWAITNGLDKYIEDITNVKKPSYLLIDDRCINFDGDFNQIKHKIKDFKVWYKKSFN